MKARNRYGPAMQFQRAVRAIAASAALFLGVFAVWKGGDFLLNQFVFSNHSFALENIDVQTDGIIPLDQIRKWSAVRPGDNLVKLDLSRVKRDLELVPCIESAAVEKILPRTLVIRVTEREPIAQVCLFLSRGAQLPLEPKTYYLDREGYVIPGLNLIAPNSNLLSNYFPSITGITPGQLLTERPVSSDQIRAALRFLGDFARSSIAGAVTVNTLDVSALQTLQVTTDDGSQVTLASGNFEEQLDRWRKIYDYGLRLEKTIASLDLAVGNYVPTRWLEVSQAPALRPRLNKPSLYRKKHV